jgi:receptor protein-tyrosine kinase
MSKIERALRKAEEDRRKRAPEQPVSEPQKEDIIATPAGMVKPAEHAIEISHLSESFRKVAARLRSCCETMGLNDIVFTSAVSGEGKTTNAINCALSLCKDFNLSVCLIDCDLRNPKISSYFSSNGSPGIIEVLKGSASVDSAVQSTSVKGLSVVLSHRVGSQSLPLLNTERLSRMVNEFRRRFDYVIFDTSPVLPLTDTVVLSTSVSGVVLVVEAGRTRRKHLEQIFEQIDRNKIVGFIMNYKKSRMPGTYNYKKYYNYGQEHDRPA